MSVEDWDRELSNCYTITLYTMKGKLKCSLRNVCIPSKPVLLILISAFLIGIAYSGVTITTLQVSQYIQHRVPKKQHSHFIEMILLNLILAMFGLFYPLTGYIGDIYTGRFKLIKFGFEIIWTTSFGLTIYTALGLVEKHTIQAVTAVISVLLVMVGVSCYRSNIIQFGFDQLLDMPSCYLSMFVHWYFWADSLGNFLTGILVSTYYCLQNPIYKVTYEALAFSLPLLFTLVLMVIYTLQKYEFFNTDFICSNPYKLIYRVLVFAWKNKRPVRPPSAFVYGDRDVRPSRLNLAKERFGGPFPNSDVEDVKTFTRVLCILMTLLPLFVLEVPVSDGVFSLFTLHTGTSATNNYTHCTAVWMILGSGGLSYLTQVVFFPLYIWIMFSVLRNRVPKILVRMTIAAILYVLAISSMLTVDLAGHIIHASHIENSTDVNCMLLQGIGPHANINKINHNTLHLHWSVLILPNLLVGVAPKLLMATALEFISAQTPHTMKGVMVGMLFMIRGTSQLLSSLLVLPFSAPVWRHDHSIISCGFGYLLLTIVVAIIGLVCFVRSACKYRYRVRGEEVFSQCQVEEVFERRLRQEQEFNQLVHGQAHPYDESLSYGTFQ